MTAVTDTRKRPRDDDNCEFMPLSKRINNLRINTIGTSIISGPVVNTPESNNHNQDLPQIANTFPENVEPDCGRPTYNPELTPSESSYYYANKLLFDLYLERLQRTGQQYPY